MNDKAADPPARYGAEAAEIPQDGKIAGTPVTASPGDEQRERIAGSGLFDDDWYLEQNPDVRAAGVDPLAHYLEYGALLMRFISSIANRRERPLA
jgi:hypothetical protein